MDLDCIVLRPLNCLPDNTVGMRRGWIKNWLENGVMTFKTGHPFLYYLMDYMIDEFNPESYMSIGPPTLTSGLLDFCDRDDLPVEGGAMSCSNGSFVNLEPHYSFYALDNKDKNSFFDTKMNPDDLDALKFSFVSHIYNAGHGTKCSAGWFPLQPTSS